MGRSAYLVSPTTRHSAALLSASGAAFSISSSSSATFHAKSLATSAFGVACNTALSLQHPYRAFSISTGTVASFVYPDRVLSIASVASANISAKAIVNRSFSQSSASVVGFSPNAVKFRTVEIASETSVFAEFKATAKAKFRVKSRSKLDAVPKFEKIAKFNVVCKSKLTPAARKYVDMRMRARSRTIMRLRSAPWPW